MMDLIGLCIVATITVALLIGGLALLLDCASIAYAFLVLHVGDDLAMYAMVSLIFGILAGCYVWAETRD